MSFVIPAHNEEAELPRTLTAIRDAAATVTPRHEVIVVDDASTDRTAEIAAEYGATVVSVDHRQIAAARNAGAREARGRYFIFVDADTQITWAGLRAAVDALDGGAIGGGAWVVFDDVPALARSALVLLQHVLRATGVVPGCFFFMTREGYHAAGGFDEQFYASEEAWLAWELRKRGRFVRLRETIITSGRKVRMHTQTGLLIKAFAAILRGPRAWKKREALDLWYDGRRESGVEPRDQNR